MTENKVTDAQVTEIPVTAADLLSMIGEGVLTVTINRPHKNNAMTWEVIRGIRSILACVKGDDSIRVVVLAGAGENAFCAGADLRSMHGKELSTIEMHEARGELAQLYLDLWHLGKPTIAKVQGWAVAGGFGLALACDLVLASDRARFGAPEVDVGLWPYMITVPMLRSMPAKQALELMMTGRKVDAAEGLQLGFLTRVVSHEELDGAVEELAATLASKSPTVMRLGREAFYAVWDMPAADALGHMQAMLSLTTHTDDAAEGAAAFLDKRPPRWTGR